MPGETVFENLELWKENVSETSGGNWLSYKLKYPSLLLFILSLFNTIVFTLGDITDYYLIFKRSIKTRLKLDKGTIRALSMTGQWNSGTTHVYQLLMPDYSASTMHSDKIWPILFMAVMTNTMHWGKKLYKQRFFSVYREVRVNNVLFTKNGD